MLSVHIICVGKMKEKFYTGAAEEYCKRLSAYCKLTVTELSEEKLPQDPSPAQIDAALAKEGQAIPARIPSGSHIVALCVEGKPYSSEQLAQLVSACELNSAKHLVFLIGGSFGLHQSIKDTADLKLSMSPMTFPHHMARVMLLEQIYRAYQLSDGTRYHK